MGQRRRNMRARRADMSFGGDSVNLFFMEITDGLSSGSVRRCAAGPLVMKEQPIDFVVDPFITLDMQESQKLMDDLWDCGLRPSEGSGSASAMKAVQNHLKDMKKILFHKLTIKE